MSKIFLKTIHFIKIIWAQVTGIPFITLSIFGNAIVFFFALIMYLLEKDINPKMTSYMDALWWSFTTTSTVGYGDVVPITIAGKFVGILLMLIGVAIFGIYTALFARAIIDDKNYMD